MSSYQTSPYTHFHELLDTWTKHTQAMETQAKSLSEKERIIGTASDTPEFRSRLDDDEGRLHDLAAKTKSILKELADEMNKRKNELSTDDKNKAQRLATAMANAVKKYQDVVTSISKKRQQFQNSNNNALIDFGNEGLTEADMYQRLQLQEQLQANNILLIQQNEEQFAIEEQVQQVQTDVIEINHIMRDISAIVSEQSPIIAGIEQSVSAANDNIIAGNHQLNSAANYQKKSRKKLCYLLLIFLIIAAIITIVLVLKLKK